MKRSKKADLLLSVRALLCAKLRNASHPLRALVSSSVAWGPDLSMLLLQFWTFFEGKSCLSPRGIPSAVPGPEQMLTQHPQGDHLPHGCADQDCCYVRFRVRQVNSVSWDDFSPEVEGPPLPTITSLFFASFIILSYCDFMVQVLALGSWPGCRLPE